jgi:hypothetical protein
VQTGLWPLRSLGLVYSRCWWWRHKRRMK